MRILFLSPRQCWPVVSGAKLRDYHLARCLGNHAELTYVYFSNGEPTAAEHLPFCSRSMAVPKPKPYTLGKIARGVFDRLPLTLINYSSRQMASLLAELTANSTFDLVHMDSIHMVPYLPVLPEALRKRVVFNWHNIESELLFRYASQTSSRLRGIYASMTARRLAEVEQRILDTSLGHLVCSEREQKVLAGQAPRARIAVVENGVDTKTFGETGSSNRNRVLFVGSMQYHANSDAILWFAERVWPAIHAQFPHWKLTVLGSDPPASIRALAARSDVEVTGTVPDLRPYYAEAIVSVVPLLTGGGTRLKILEALAAGVPVISTSLGAEGLMVTDKKDILIAQNEQDWLPACASLANDPELWQRLVAAGRNLVEARYDWDVIGKALLETYEQWLRAV